MKFSGLASVLSLAALATAAPEYQWARRQLNSTVGATNATTTSPSGANAGAQGTGLTTVTSTTTLLSGATVAVQITLSIGINGVAVPIATGTPYTVVSNSGAAAGAVPGAAAAAPVAIPAQVIAAGNAGVATVASALAAAACTCAPAVVATGIYTVTVVNQINLGTSTYITSYPTTTLGAITVQGGSIIPATPVVTNYAVLATNTNAPLAAGQAYRTVVIPGTNGAPSITVTVIVNINVNVGNANNGGAGAGTGAIATSLPFSNGTTSSIGSGAGVGAGQTSLTSLGAGSASTTSASVGTPLTAASTNSVSTTPTTAPTSVPTTVAGGTQVGAYGQTPLYNQPQFITDLVNAHNAYRRRHGGPDVTWDPNLANVALANVNRNAADGTFLHTTEQGVSDPYGENIGSQYGQNNPLYLVYLWYNELYNPGYDFNNPGFSSGTGHFTQLVWKASTTIGCAYTKANDARGTYYLACEYNAPGNVQGNFPANVVPVSDGSAAPGPPPTSV